MAYSITVGGVDRTADIIAKSITIEDVINDKQNTCRFQLMDLSGSGAPQTDDEIIITLADNTRIFAGYIVSVVLAKKNRGSVLFEVSSVDYARLLDQNLVHQTYEDMTDQAIIQSIIDEYCAGLGISYTNVLLSVTISQVSYNYLQVSQVFKKICDLTGRNWYIDYNKDVHYFPLTTNTTPFNIDNTNDEYIDLKISKNSAQLKNRVYVRGGTKLSDYTTYSVKGDGVARSFPLPDKPHSVSITVNGSAKTLGIKNIHTSGYDWYLNYDEKYLEQDTGGSVLTSSDTLAITYKYDIPILVALEHTASIADNGIKEFAIFDKSITTTDAARDRASAELTDYANAIIEGSFRTHTAGFISGQYININLSEYGINDNYIVQKVVARSIGAGNFIYDISLASSKTMGIIRFLIELLESNKNLIDLDENEVVDELFELTDSLLTDSLLDSLVIDSMGGYATWCAGSETTPATRARWELFQWG